jgi:hypothetical protein
MISFINMELESDLLEDFCLYLGVDLQVEQEMLAEFILCPLLLCAR